MNLIKIISIYLLFFHLSSLALDSWSFTVNGIELECQGHEKDRFWHCESSYYSGLIDRKPDNKSFAFLPLLMSTKGIELELYFDTWTDILGDDKLYYRDIYFNYKNYRDFNSNFTDGFEPYSDTPRNRGKIKDLFNNFKQQLKSYFSDLKSINFYQNIYNYDDSLFSEFIPFDPPEEKDPSAPVDCVVTELLSSDLQEKYKEITSPIGKCVSLKEAKELCQSFARRSSIPFKYNKDGCYARTHVICAELFGNDIKTGKIWIAGKLSNPFNPQQEWRYHVAPLIYVRDENNNMEALVIDPAMNGTALINIEEWLEKYNASKARLVSFPIPGDCHYFEDIVMAFSSHAPMYHSCYEYTVPLYKSLESAFVINNKHREKLAAQPQ